MTKKIAKFLNSYKFNVQISFDGSEYYHNQERKTSIGIGSYKRIKESIGKLFEDLIEFRNHVSVYFDFAAVPKIDKNYIEKC